MPDPTGRISHLPDMHRGVAWKEPVRAALTTNITLSAPGATIDGVTMAAGYRFGAFGQTTATESGIYVWTGAASAAIRAFDMDQDTSTSVPASEAMGAFVYVIGGTLNGGKLFHATNTTPPVLGTNAVVFEEWAGGAGGASTPFDHGNMGATETVSLADGDWHRGTLTADCTITVEGFTIDQGATLLFGVMQDGTGGWAITWDADVVWAGDDQPGQDPGDVTWYLLWSDEGDGLVYGAKVGTTGGTAGTPALTLSTTNATGSAGTFVATDATIAIFDATAPTTLDYSDVAATGSAAVASRRDHRHGMPAAGGGGIGPILISDTPSTPLVFADLIQNEAQDDLVYADP